MFALSWGVFAPYIGRDKYCDGDVTVLKISKVVTLCVIVGAAVFAFMRYAKIAEIFMLGAAASCAVFIPSLVCELYWKRGTGQAAKISSVMGFLTVLIWMILFGSNGNGAGGLHAMIPGQVVGWLGFLIASYVAKPLD